MAVAVSISPMNSTASQPPRFFIIVNRSVWKYGLSSASMPPNFWMSSVASSCTTSTMSSTVTMPFTCLSASTTGTATRSCRADQARDRLLIHVVGDGHHVRLHHVLHLLVAAGREQLAKADHAQQVLLAVEHVHVVDGLDLVLRLATQIADRLVHGHVRADAREARVHQTAGLVLRVGHQRADLAARRIVEQRQILAPLVVLELVEHVRRVVGRQHPHPQPALPVGQARQHAGLTVGGQAQEEVVRVLRQEQLEAFGPLLRRQDGPDLPELFHGEAVTRLGPRHGITSALESAGPALDNRPARLASRRDKGKDPGGFSAFRRSAAASPRRSAPLRRAGAHRQAPRRSRRRSFARRARPSRRPDSGTDTPTDWRSRT